MGRTRRRQRLTMRKYGRYRRREEADEQRSGSRAQLRPRAMSDAYTRIADELPGESCAHDSRELEQLRCPECTHVKCVLYCFGAADMLVCTRCRQRARNALEEEAATDGV